MNQKQADKIFNTSLGQQLDMFYCCSDDKVFIRHEEALNHTNEMINSVGNQKFVDTTITEWYPSNNCYNDLPESMDIGNNDLGHY